MAVANATATSREQCPWCDSVITHEKFLQVKERIRAEEKKQHDALAAQMKAKFDDELREQKNKLQEAQLERAKLEEKMKRDIEAAAAAAKKTAEEAAAQRAAAELQRARELDAAKYQEELLNVKADAAKKLEDALKKLHELESKSVHAEPTVDVLEELKTAFDEDRIVPMPPDTGAATIIVEVKIKNAICGKILIDARPRKSWQTNFASKLREEMLEAKADHAILATTVFPKDEEQICEHNDVLVVHPARVVEIVRMLRRLVVRMSQLKASNEQRADGKTKLYDLLTSSAGRQRLAESGVVAKQIEKLDVDEADEHRKVWKKRNDLTKKLQKLSNDLLEEIEEIAGSAK